MATFVHIPYSPWSRRAYLAIRATGRSVERLTYTPMVSEPWLRWKLGDWSGKLTLPVLLRDDGPPLRDSMDIARWAANGGPLFSDEDTAAIEAWNERSNRALEAGRTRTTRKVLDDPASLKASLPGFVAAMGPIGMAIGRREARGLLAKYPVQGSDEVLKGMIEEVLEAIRSGLDGGRYLLGDRLTYADIVASVALSFVEPAAKAPLNPAAKARWRDAELAERYADLALWRDGIEAEALGG